MSPVRVQNLRSSVKNTRPTAGTREPGEIYTNWPDLQLGVINASKVAVDLVAVRFFSAATNYVVGDFVVQAGRGYRAKEVIVAGAFNAAQWETITVSGDFEPPIAAGTAAQYWRGDKSWQTLDKNAVGLSNVDNVSDANKPVSGPTQTALDLKANIASPTFTGTPAAPTPTYPNSSTALATTAFVSANFASLTSPALGGNPTAPTPPLNDNDTSIATTAFVQAELLDYAPLASPTFTGDPKAPTPIQGDNDTSVATTAFVTTAVAGHISDAPSDTNAYGRKAGNWVDVAEEAPADGVSYGRKNGNWVASVGGAVVSDTPPLAPLITGQLWYEADSGNTYLWYTDADSSQWVQVNVQPAPAAAPAVVGTAQTRNRVVNGAMQISQEYGNTVLGPAAALSTHAADQWVGWSSTSPGTATQQRVQVVTPNGSQNRIRMTVNVAKPALAAADYIQLRQAIEGVKVADFRWGTAQAKQVVARFGFKAPAGTYALSLMNDAGNRTYIALITITAGQANTDTEQTFVIPGDVTGTWEVDTDVGIYFRIILAAGTTVANGATGWQAGGPMTTPAQTNGMATVGNTFELFDVGLYLDPANTGKAPDWTMPDEAEELRACQRYYWKTGVRLQVYSLGNFMYTIQYPTSMRTQAALTFPDVTYSNASGIGVTSPQGPTGVTIFAVATTTGQANFSAATVHVNARM